MTADGAGRPVRLDQFTRTDAGDGGAGPDTLPAGGAARPVGVDRFTRTAARDRGGGGGRGSGKP